MTQGNGKAKALAAQVGGLPAGLKTLAQFAGRNPPRCLRLHPCLPSAHPCPSSSSLSANLVLTLFSRWRWGDGAAWDAPCRNASHAQDIFTLLDRAGAGIHPPHPIWNRKYPGSTPSSLLPFLLLFKQTHTQTPRHTRRQPKSTRTPTTNAPHPSSPATSLSLSLISPPSPHLLSRRPTSNLAATRSLPSCEARKDICKANDLATHHLTTTCPGGSAASESRIDNGIGAMGGVRLLPRARRAARRLRCGPRPKVWPAHSGVEAARRRQAHVCHGEGQRRRAE